MAGELYLDDSYLKEWEAMVVSVKDEKYVILDQTCFYPNSGGQLWDTGRIICGGVEYKVLFVGKFDEKISHEVDKGGIKDGDKVHCIIDWDRRYKLMRMHTAAHVISGVFYHREGILITGGQLGIDKSRMDFSFENIDKKKMNDYMEEVNNLINQDLKVKVSYMNIEEAKKDPSLFKLAAEFKHNIQNVRIVEIEGLDKQLDGGTHVKSLSEVGPIEIVGFENKGKGRKRFYFKVRD